MQRGHFRAVPENSGKQAASTTANYNRTNIAQLVCKPVALWRIQEQFVWRAFMQVHALRRQFIQCFQA